MTTPAEEVAYEPPTSGAGPCANNCGNQAQKYGPAVGSRPSSPLCNVCLAKAQAKWRKPGA